ncbi:cation transport ATPase [Bradyrhizobium sp. i1.4.4]
MQALAVAIVVILALGMSVVETIHHAARFFRRGDHAAYLAASRPRLGAEQAGAEARGRGNLAVLKAEMVAKFVGPVEISQVPAAIHSGDIVLLRPGERCSVDGTVIDGRSEIVQSLITGAALSAGGASSPAPVRSGSPFPPCRQWPRYSCSECCSIRAT